TVARQLDKLIDQLHTHARVGRKPDFVPVDCAAVLAEACGSLRAALDESRAVVTADPLPTIHGVKPELVVLFQNLIENAVKFRAEQPPAIHVGARHDGENWLLSVRDNGIGIEAEYLERIFVLGERLHGSKIPGSGIGLTNCRRIVENNGGRIWVESQP